MPNKIQVFFADIKEIPPVLQNPYLPSLDGFRGISVIMVIIFHILTKRDYLGFRGDFGVTVFFVISGFIITTLLLKEKVKKGNVSLTKFYIRRSLKILPVAYIYLLAMVLVNLYYKCVKPSDILSAALFIKNTNIIPTWLDGLTGHFWSLSVEEQFYVVFPFILCRSIKSYLVIVFVLLIFIPVALNGEHKGVSFFVGTDMHNFLDFFVTLLRFL
jgi:peptidoglycan/LPS O-acetylase OafA/YrhL